jgi:hypothetical protein
MPPDTRRTEGRAYIIVREKYKEVSRVDSAAASPRSLANASAAPYKYALTARVHAWGEGRTSAVLGLAESESGVRAQGQRCGAGQHLVGGIDHGPGSNQPFHHL